MGRIVSDEEYYVRDRLQAPLSRLAESNTQLILGRTEAGSNLGPRGCARMFRCSTGQQAFGYTQEELKLNHGAMVHDRPGKRLGSDGNTITADLQAMSEKGFFEKLALHLISSRTSARQWSPKTADRFRSARSFVDEPRVLTSVTAARTSSTWWYPRERKRLEVSFKADPYSNGRSGKKIRSIGHTEELLSARKDDRTSPISAVEGDAGLRGALEGVCGRGRAEPAVAGG